MEPSFRFKPISWTRTERRSIYRTAGPALQRPEYNQVVNDINAGNFTTDALNINMYPNTFLFSINNQGQFAGCCVLGFHTYFFESGVTPQPRWIFNFASWISPGLFGAGFQDVTALSHEIAETIADPFVNTIVPTWQFPGVAPTAKVCQANLEEGDPIEVLPVATVPSC